MPAGASSSSCGPASSPSGLEASTSTSPLTIAARFTYRGPYSSRPLLERAALLQERAQLVVLILEVQLVDARLHLVVELLDEAAGLAGEAVELALERADQAGVAAELAERGHDVLLVHALGELRA